MATRHLVISKFSVILVLLGLVLAGLVIYRVGSRPPEVVVGPVYPLRGVPGIAEVGMTRKEVIDVLGKPLIPRDLRRNSWGENPIRMADYMPGIFAEIEWGHDRLGIMSFDLDRFARKYHGELKVCMVLNGKTTVLSRRLTLDQARRLLKRLGLTRKQIHDVKGSGLYIDLQGTPSAVILLFSENNNHLKEASFVLPP